MSFIQNALIGNPFSTPVGSKIEQATDASQASENWALNMEICDIINETEEGSKDAIRAIKKRLSQSAGKDYTVVMYTLTILETCVKNCGKRFHLLTCSKDFVQELVKLLSPKNDPPTVVQEKVLSLIQCWASAFQADQDLLGVNVVYKDLLAKGIEFPATDLDSLAPIHTPRKSVNLPEVVPASAPSPSGSPIPPLDSPNHTGTLTMEQRAKLQSELDVVQSNMNVLGEMLSEVKPGRGERDELDLLQELRAVCQSMQQRLMELISRITNDSLTEELLRINDDMNNLFLRYSRWEKNTVPSASAVIANAIPPTAVAKPALKNDDSLIDLDDDDLADTVNKLGLGDASNFSINAKKGTDEFDMFAQSRNVTYESAKSRQGLSGVVIPHTPIPNATDKDQPSRVRFGPCLFAGLFASGSPPAGPDSVRKIGIVLFFSSGSTYKDNINPDQIPGGISSATRAPETDEDRELNEMANWLGKTGGGEESVTSSDFERFLAERAAAAENLPTVSATTGPNNPSTLKKETKKKAEDLLAERDENRAFKLCANTAGGFGCNRSEHSLEAQAALLLFFAPRSVLGCFGRFPPPDFGYSCHHPHQCRRNERIALKVPRITDLSVYVSGVKKVLLPLNRFRSEDREEPSQAYYLCSRMLSACTMEMSPKVHRRVAATINWSTCALQMAQPIDLKCFSLTYNGACLGTIKKKFALKAAGGTVLNIPLSKDHIISDGMMSPIQAASVPAEPPKTHFVLTPTSSDSNQSGNHSNGEQRSQCSSLSDGENFEWNGEGEVTKEVPNETSFGGLSEARSPLHINRNTWLRTSLKRSTPNNPDSLPNRRWGSFRHNGRRAQNLSSNALASQLYRSSSFNSSGRSSTCDTTDDMYSDASLEEDVHDLHHKVSPRPCSWSIKRLAGPAISPDLEPADLSSN
ncbi:hypothetical protein HUJ04_008702 [Dendroctonus ponderosae]|nr:hypothetical protein HUJ04_008702 [Dendroctonus ponderosae]